MHLCLVWLQSTERTYLNINMTGIFIKLKTSQTAWTFHNYIWLLSTNWLLEVLLSFWDHDFKSLYLLPYLWQSITEAVKECWHISGFFHRLLPTISLAIYIPIREGRQWHLYRVTQARGAIAVANISHLVSIFSPALPSSGNLARCRLEKDSLCKFTLRALPTLKPAPLYRVLKHLQFTLL